MEFLADYGLFLAKTLTLVVAVALIFGFLATLSKRVADSESLQVDNLNRRYRSLASTLKGAALGKRELKALLKAHKDSDKSRRKSGATRPRTFVIDFKGDLRATGTTALREEINAVIGVAGDDDEVLVRLDNAGGTVHEHGLAASQLLRLRERGIALTVAVDKVAASGGYLMACVADRIVAAPFAILGSIGVLAQLPNFNRLLEKHGIDFEQITAGRHKRSVTMFGKNTDEDREKLKQELEDIHELFKSMVQTYRPSLDLEQVATGEHWYGRRALELNLADELATSDELLLARLDEREVLKVSYKARLPLKKKVLGLVDAVAGRLAGRP